MATDTGRDDFIIAIRSAFLKKGTRQKFSLFTLLIISILVLSLEYFKSGPVNTFRSITKDIIFKGSYFISSPFAYLKNNYYYIKDHLKMYEEYTNLKKKNYSLESLKNDNEFYKSENKRLKKLIDEKNIYSNDFLLSKVLLDKQSPYLNSVIINKGFKHGITLGLAVKEKSYFVGKIINVNFLTSRILLASDLNSKIPVIIEPTGANAIMTGQGQSNHAELEYLPKLKKIKKGDIVYTSGVDDIIPQAIPIGKIIESDENLVVEFFVDFNQLKYVKVSK
jgi:rod shape-determining protein MreC